jgi:hypothetical protein
LTADPRRIASKATVNEEVWKLDERITIEAGYDVTHNDELR